jgi:hypothetical protein
MDGIGSIRIFFNLGCLHHVACVRSGDGGFKTTDPLSVE